jgi:hypothetical protein
MKPSHPVASFGLAALLALSTSYAPPASAAPPAPAESPQARYRKAHQAIARNDYLAARELLLGLWQESKTYDVATSLGQVEFQLKNYASGATFMAYALAHVTPAEKPERVDTIRTALKELSSKVGTARVSVSHPEAELLVDGKVVDTVTLPADIYLDPGERQLEARHAEAGSAEQVLQVVAGQTYTVDLRLTGAHPDPLVTPAPSAATSRPVVQTPQTAEADRPVEAAPPSWPIWISGGVTAIGVGVAVGFGLAANAAESDWEDLKNQNGDSGCADDATSPACRAQRDALDREHRHTTWATVGVGMAGAGAAATLVYVLLWPSPERTSQSARSTHVKPTFDLHRSGASIFVSGSF